MRAWSVTGLLRHDGWNVVRNTWQEVRELGLSASMFRVRWELAQRLAPPTPPREGDGVLTPWTVDACWASRLPFADPRAVGDAMRDRVPVAAVQQLVDDATAALEGRLRCFGRWVGDFGNPIDWQRQPHTGRSRDAALPSTRMVADDPVVGDIKLTWEIGRFPHAFTTARAAAFAPDLAPGLSAGLYAQLQQFEQLNPVGFGAHWNSGQEVAIRSCAWLFALDTLLLPQGTAGADQMIAAATGVAARYVRAHIAFAQRAVNNNHLISEALLLYVAGALLAGDPRAAALRTFGRSILVQEADRQFFPDGGYLNLSHNYHRTVIQHLLYAVVVSRATGERPPDAWIAALERSMVFLLAHLNPHDGRLPNFGANDGSRPSVLSTCDFSDFRPTLQAVSVATRGERLFPPGPWDEEAAWLFGPACLDLPLKPPLLTSASFVHSGFHVWRSRDDSGTFVAFRCGSVQERFSQIDMLHVDVFCRGENVLVDGGSYLYNGDQAWHDYFLETASHNTITIDGRDQMLHYRKFKNLYQTQARLLSVDTHGDWTVLVGEHLGYRRHPGACIHRRAVAAHTSGACVIRDSVLGSGEHIIRVHWLAGPFPWHHDVDAGGLTLDTPSGAFRLLMRHEDGRVPDSTIASGIESPPRGWLSRYYAERLAVPSLAAEFRGRCPTGIVTAFGPDLQSVDVGHSGGVRMTLDDGTHLGLRLGPDGGLSFGD